ncbi:MAG: alpha-E domain-containing protein [Candidatus Margulisiibacteriota bacterium]
MLSRVADAIYWMNRYVERVRNMSRFMEVSLNLMLELPQDFTEQWEPMIKAVGDEHLFNRNYAKPSKETVAQYMTFDRFNPNSMMVCLEAARENARSVREHISTEVWRHLNNLYLTVREASANPDWSTENLFLLYDQIKQGCYLILGVSHATLSHSDEWQFGRLGMFLERMDNMTRILDAKYYYLLPQSKSVANTFELIQWIAVLRSMGAYEMYLREYGLVDPIKIAEFLLLSSSFPSSIRFSLIQAQKALHAITGNDRRSFKFPVEKALGRLKANLDYIEIQEIFEFGLHDYLNRIQSKGSDIGDLIFETFFILNPIPEAGQS